ncbi:DoxX family membrane protein [Pseudoalteromonas sp. B137]
MKIYLPKFLKSPDLGLLYLRVTASLLVIYIYGLPKIINYQVQLKVIEAPFKLGQSVTLLSVIFTEFICPIAIILGIYTRLACLPLLLLLFVAMLGVHSDWTVEEGQFGWLLIIIFSSLALCGPGQYCFPLSQRK